MEHQAIVGSYLIPHLMFCRFVWQLAFLLLMLVVLGMNLRRSQDIFLVDIGSNTNTNHFDELKKYSVEELEHEIQRRQATKIASYDYGHLSNVSSSDVLGQDRKEYVGHSPVHKDGASPTDTYDSGGGKPKILWGIFSMNKPSEILRRQCIRETYLSFYKTLPGSSPSHDYYHRICSLAEYKHWHKTNDTKYVNCKMIYAFVMGSNKEPNAYTDLCEAVQMDPLYPLTIAMDGTEKTFISSQEAAALLASETDIVHLNIMENMNQGKTTSWFRYGVSLLDSGVGSQGGLYFDYIAKADGDKVVFPDKFFHQMQVLNLPVPPSGKTELVFGGYPAVFGPDSIQAQWLDGAPFYMSGELYFLSRELARYVTSNGLNRTRFDSYRPHNKQGHEDLSMGKFVFSHPKQQEIVFIKIKKRGDPIGPHGSSKHAFVSLVVSML